MKKTVVIAILAVFLIALVPLFVLKDAEFGGSDDAGSTVVEEVNSSYESWATPVLEILIGGELPGEVESLFFCLQLIQDLLLVGVGRNVHCVDFGIVGVKVFFCF